MLVHRRVAPVALALILTLGVAAGTDYRASGLAAIRESDMRQWLSFLASDDLEGRATFSEGLGLAAGYVAGNLQSWGIEPGGDNGSYFQRVKVLGVKSENRSSVTVTVNGQKRVFRHGEGIEFPRNVGGARKVTIQDVEFLGYGLHLPDAGHDDYAGKDVSGKAVIWLGQHGPAGLTAMAHRRAVGGRGRYAIDRGGAVASIGPAGAGSTRPVQPASTGPLQQPDFTTAQRLDHPVAPGVTASDELFEFLFSQAPVKYSELRQRAEKQATLPSFTLKGVSLVFDIDADYQVVRTQYTRNVIGLIRGSDPTLEDTYVVFGAHLDHVGYAEGPIVDTPGGPRRQGAVGRVGEGALEDRIWNGADDNGSGSAAIMAVAKAFASVPPPRRSVLFVWYSGEERGLWGSRYHADHPGFDPSAFEAMINLDMVGRNRNDRPEEANRLYLIGSDRISTDLHDLAIEANFVLPKPLELDFELNDPADPEQLYYRSDHYSYAVKGVPSVFFTTALHPDYHANTDRVDRINFEKMSRVAQLAFETGRRIAEREAPLTRDNQGPRAGKGTVVTVQ
jgi:hypothetical protein